MESLCADGSTDAILTDFSTLQPPGQHMPIPGPNSRGAADVVLEQSFIVDSNDPGSRYFSHASSLNNGKAIKPAAVAFEIKKCNVA